MLYGSYRGAKSDFKQVPKMLDWKLMPESTALEDSMGHSILAITCIVDGASELLQTLWI